MSDFAGEPGALAAAGELTPQGGSGPPSGTPHGPADSLLGRVLRVVLFTADGERAAVLTRALEFAGPRFEVRRAIADELSAAGEYEDVDLALIECSPAAPDPRRALAQLREMGSEAAAILVATSTSEDSLLDALAAGAADYVTWDNLAPLAMKIVRALALVEHRRRARAEIAALRTSEARYRLLVESSRDLAAILDAQGVVQYASPSFHAVLGYEPESLLGHSAFALLHPEDSQRVRGHIALRGSLAAEASRIELRLRHRDGTWAVCEATYEQHRSGDALALLLSARDVTEQHAAAIERRDNEAVAEALTSVSRALVSSLADPDLPARLAALAREALRGDAATILLHRAEANLLIERGSCRGAPGGADDAPSSAAEIRGELGRLCGSLERSDVVEAGDKLSAQLPGAHRSLQGPLRHLCVALRRGDELLGILVVSRPVRERPFRPAERRIAQGIARIGSFALESLRLMDDQQLARRLQGEFVANMSHELRTPVHIILGYVELLLDGQFGALDEAQVDAMSRIGRSARALTEMVANTLQVSFLDHEPANLRPVQISLEELFFEISQETRELQRKPSVAFTWRVDRTLPPLRVDAAKLKLAVRNLISNAVKFTESGRITVAARPVPGGVEISVADTGDGIATELLPIVFEPFFRGSEAARTRHQGLGLGLYVAQRLVTALGGRIEVESEIGKGSTFRIALPQSVLTGADPQGG